MSRAGIALKGVATTIEDLNTALSLADQNGMSAEEKRKLKKKVPVVCNMATCKRVRLQGCQKFCLVIQDRSLVSCTFARGVLFD